MKQALGFAVSGTEVRLAHLVSDNGQIRLEALERAKLKTSLETPAAAEKNEAPSDGELSDAFGLKESAGEKAFRENQHRADSANIEVLYGLLDRFTQNRIKIACNVPLSMVSYQGLPGPVGAMSVVERLGGTDRVPSLNLGQRTIKGKDGTSITMSFENHPPTMSLLRELNGFVRGNLHLDLMETTEIALANLARISLSLPPDRVTAIVYLEEEFSRLLFLRGEDLIHVSSLINESASSPDILEVIYRRLLYEQDEAQIPEIAMILLAGKGSRMRAKDFFAAQCPGVEVDYLYSDKLGKFPANEIQRAVFSEFAVAIALAWQLLEPKHPSFVPMDLLPQEFKDQQQVLKLNVHGYILLALTGLVAFFFTWQILRLRYENEGISSKNRQLEEQIKRNQETVDRVHNLEVECKRLDKNLVLSDSLSKGYDEFLLFLQKMNRSVRRTGSVWVEEILKSQNGFSIKGTSLRRETIPFLAEQLENASLRRVTRMEDGKQKLFAFELERQNAPSTGGVQFSSGGVRIIDGQSNGGSLILGRENSLENPATAIPQNQNGGLNQSSFPPPRPLPNSNDIRTRTNGSNGLPSGGQPFKGNNTTFNGVVKEASSGQMVSAPPRSNNNGGSASPPRPSSPPPAEAPRERMKSASAAKPEAATASTEKFTARESAVMESAQIRANPGTPAAPPNDEATTGGGAASASSPQDKIAPPPAAAALPVAQPVYRWYSIEAGTTNDRSLADQLQQAYTRQGLQAAVEDYWDDAFGRKRSRVLIGMFKTKEGAEKKAEELGDKLVSSYRIVGVE